MAENSTIAENFTSNLTCEDTPFYQPIYSIVAAVSVVSGFVSLMASCFVIFILVIFKKWRFFTQRLILYLAIAAAAKAMAVIVQRVDYENQTSAFYYRFCTFGGFFSQVTSVMVINAIMAITMSLLYTAFRKKAPENYEPLVLLLVFLAPLVFSWIPFIHHAYGRAGPWCWIRSTDHITCETFRFGQVLQFVLFYIPLYLVLLVLMVLYAILLVKLHLDKRKWRGKFDTDAEWLRKVRARQILPLIFLPVVFFALYFPLAFNRIYDFIDPDHPQLALWFIAAALFPLEGGGVAIVVTLDPKTRRRLRIPSIKAALRDFLKNSSGVVVEYPLQDKEQLHETLLVNDRVPGETP
jgi:hypothetical protein